MKWRISFCSGEPIQANLGAVEFDFVALDELVEVQRGIESADGQAVGLGDAIEIIGRDDAAGAGHVLRDDVGIAGNVFRQITGSGARPEIVAAAVASSR